jgi:hypothetical protein
MSYMSNLHIEIMRWLDDYPVQKDTTREKVLRDMMKRFSIVKSREEAASLYNQWKESCAGDISPKEKS